MARWRTTPTNLRLLLLGAIGGAVWACAGKTNECTEGGCPANPDGLGGAGTMSSIPGCTNPVPLLDDAQTGIFRCDEQHLWRKDALSCPSVLPRDTAVEWPEHWGAAGAPSYSTGADECSSDLDCEDEHAACRVELTNPGGCGDFPEPKIYARICKPGCRDDSDCAQDQICLCGPEIGECTTVSEIAGCRQDSDCQPGYHCLSNAREAGLFSTNLFACQLPGDTCNWDGDCDVDFCIMSESGRSCISQPECGRPFLIADLARTAAAIASPAWLAAPGDLDLSHLQRPTDAALRARLAAHWTQIGLLEHASVAAFARFTLQLLSLGAPAELIELSQEAALDEIRHAKLAFALASRYAGHDVGPGALPIGGALEACGLEDILRMTVREGCVGETRAALEASRAAELCEDPAVRAVLEAIAADEARHAELAWRAVRHVVTLHPELSYVLAEEFMAIERQERLRSAQGDQKAAAPSEAARYGLLEGAALDECHRVAHRDVILPCARTMIASAAALAA